MEYLKCAGSAVGIGVAWYSSKLAKDVVKDTEHEFERKRRVADDCRRELGNASSSLKAMRSKKAQTVGLVACRLRREAMISQYSN